MQIIIDILAGNGFLTVLGFVWVLCVFWKEKSQKARDDVDKTGEMPLLVEAEIIDGSGNDENKQ